MAGITILASESGEWSLALAGIAFFGLCAAAGIYMLILSGRSVAP